MQQINYQFSLQPPSIFFFSFHLVCVSVGADRHSRAFLHSMNVSDFGKQSNFRVDSYMLLCINCSFSVIFQFKM